MPDNKELKLGENPIFPQPQQKTRKIAYNELSRFLTSVIILLVVIFFTLMIAYSGYICRTDTYDQLVGDSWKDVLVSLGKLSQNIDLMLSNNPWISLFILLIPFLLILTGLFLSKKPKIWSILLLATPFLFILIDTFKGKTFWPYAWKFAVIIIFFGFLFGVIEKKEIKRIKLSFVHKKMTWILVGVLLLLCLSLGFTLRFIWVDEVPYFFDADATKDMYKLIDTVFVKNKSPLEYFKLRRMFQTRDEAWYMCLGGYAFKYWGISLLSIRMTTVLYGVFTLFLWYLLLAYHFDRKFALLGTTLLCILPIHVSYSRYGHTFHMTLIIFLLSSLFAYKLLDTNKLRYAIVTGFIVGWSYAFHLSVLAVFFLIPAILLSGWIQRKTQLKTIINHTWIMLVSACIASTMFWINFDKHNFGHTARKGVYETELSGKLYPVQRYPLGENLIRNFNLVKQFFMRNNGPGSFIRGGGGKTGGQQYYPPTPVKPVQFSLLLGLVFFGLGYCLFHFKDERMRFFLWMTVFTPIPGLLSFPHDKRMLGFMLAFTGCLTISLLLFTRHLKTHLPSMFQWVPSVFVSLIILTVFLNTVLIVFNPFKDPHKRFYFNYACYFDKLLHRDIHLYTDFNTKELNRHLLFHMETIRKSGGNRMDYYTKFRTIPQLFYSITKITKDKPIGIFLQSFRKEANILKEFFPNNKFIKKRKYCYLEIDLSDKETIWGLRSGTQHKGRSQPELVFLNDGSRFDGIQYPAVWEGILVMEGSRNRYQFRVQNANEVVMELGKHTFILGNDSKGNPIVSKEITFSECFYEIRLTQNDKPTKPITLSWKTRKHGFKKVPWAAMYPSPTFKNNEVIKALNISKDVVLIPE